MIHITSKVSIFFCSLSIIIVSAQASDKRAPHRCKSWSEIVETSESEKKREETLSALLELLKNLESGKTTTMSITNESGKESYDALTAAASLACEYSGTPTLLAERKANTCIDIIQRLLKSVPSGDRARICAATRRKLPAALQASLI